MTEWFEEWFGEEYLLLYPHRDDTDAQRVVSLIVNTLGVGPAWRVLDVACGAGRHAKGFRDGGATTIGVDLSMPLLRRARAVAAVPLARCDVRALPIRPRSVDLAVNLFTSFGYFADDAAHLCALREMVRPVRPGGWFVLDFLNAPWVRASLVPRETTTLGGVAVGVERGLEQGGRSVVKTITTKEGRQFREQVRLYEREELVAMLAGAGCRVRHQFGSYDGAAPGPAAPRVVLMGQTG